MLARKWCNAYVSSRLVITNGLSHMLFYLEICHDVSLDCHLSFQLLINQEVVK